MKKLRIGVIGYGNIGAYHAENLYNEKVEGAELCCICDISEEKRTRIKECFLDIPVFSDYTEMLESGILDAVIIAVPHPLHSVMAVKAFECGLDVLCEKPLDITVSAAKRMCRSADENKRIFAVMLNQRTNGIYIKAREIVKSGALGELKRTVWIITNWYRTQSYYNSSDWRARWDSEGGGVLINQAPHNIDLWQWICGMPQSLTAFCDEGKYHRIEVEDDVTIVARYKNGATGTFITTTGEYPGTNRLEISGTLGKMVLENGILKWWKLSENERDVCENNPQSFPDIDYEYHELTNDIPDTAHIGIIQNFVNAILNGEELLSPGVDGINELMLSNAAYLSSWKGNIAVPLPFDEAEYDRLLLQKQQNNKKKTQDKKIIQEQHAVRWQVHW